MDMVHCTIYSWLSDSTLKQWVMVLAIRELERGDGEWENIQVSITDTCMYVFSFWFTLVYQPVLRSAFLSIQRTSNKHIERMKSCEQSTQSQSRQQLKQQQHLEAVARAVNELSEALKAHIEEFVFWVNENSDSNWHCSISEEIHRQEQKSTIQSILKDVSRQLQESETRLVTQMDTLANSLAPLERRVVLVEEELHHVFSSQPYSV